MNETMIIIIPEVSVLADKLPSVVCFCVCGVLALVMIFDKLYEYVLNKGYDAGFTAGAVSGQFTGSKAAYETGLAYGRKEILEENLIRADYQAEELAGKADDALNFVIQRKRRSNHDEM